MFINNILRLNNSKTKTAINAKISIFIFCVEAIKYLLLHNLHDYTFKEAVQTIFFTLQNTLKIRENKSRERCEIIQS